MQIASRTTKLYCNMVALQKGLDPVGHAHHFEDALAVEIPLPWKNNLYREAGTLPQEVVNLLGLWLKRYQAGQGYPHRPLLIAPDSQYSRPGMSRVMFYSRPESPFAQYNKIEYLVPKDKLGALIWSLYEAKDDLPRFEIYRESPQDSTRDLLVCTHGTVDAACAKFGYPLYNDLYKNYAKESLRVWRVSHFGGHVFAPTMMDMPTGHYWAYVEQSQAEQIAHQNCDVHDLYGHYRGWAGLEDGFLQAAERELWMKYGWEWFMYRKSGHIITQDDDAEDPKWAEVQINYTVPHSTKVGKYVARVEIRKHISTPHGTNAEAHLYPQYTVCNH